MDEPPRIDPDRLDFSEFHDLMHPPFTRECRSLYGGPRRHLTLWWEFIAMRWLRRTLLCPLGRHAWCKGWSRSLGSCWQCFACYEVRER